MSKREVQEAAKAGWGLPERGIRDSAAYQREGQASVRRGALKRHPPQFGIAYLKDRSS